MYIALARVLNVVSPMLQSHIILTARTVWKVSAGTHAEKLQERQNSRYEVRSHWLQSPAEITKFTEEHAGYAPRWIVVSGRSEAVDGSPG